MTNEEMKQKLENNGYTVHKKLNEKILDRRNDLFWNIEKYYSKSANQYYAKTGKRFFDTYWCGLTTTTEWYARNRARKEMKKLGYKEYDEIEDSVWPEVKDKMLNEAKRYIDKRMT